ncbi:MAG: M15 family metallopeptidase [Desulfarculus sp.]|nr:M15 family metallopeptidase [Desulfarculus sp.]
MPYRRALIYCLALLSLLAAPALAAAPDPAQRPPDIVDVAQAVPGLLLDMRYLTSHNFLGVPVDGYLTPRCLLTRPAAQALARVQEQLAPLGLALKVYDCYRPQRAVDHFVRWALDVNDTLTKTEFYPTLDKKVLFPQGYIAERSGHSRGSTVDLTIVALPAASQPAFDPTRQVECFKPARQRYPDNGLDMGGGFDCFHEVSHTANPSVGPQQRANRALLKTLMEAQGFKGLAEEWWHYTLRDEPYPQTYFDFPVQ